MTARARCGLCLGRTVPGAVLLILAQVLIGRRRPGRRNLAAKFAPCPRGRPPSARALPAAGQRRSRGRREGGPELATVNLTQPFGSLRRVVVTRSQDEERRHPVSAQVVGQTLVIGSTAMAWGFSLGSTRRASRGSSLAVSRQAELGQPKVRLAVHNRLRSGVAGSAPDARLDVNAPNCRTRGSLAMPETHQITIPMISG